MNKQPFIDCPIDNSMRRQLAEKKGYTYEYLYELSSSDLAYLYNELIKND